MTTLTPLLVALVLEAPPASTPAAHARPYDTAIRAAAAEATKTVYPVPENLIRAVIRQESNFRPGVVSLAGAIGLMQVMPMNATRLGLTTDDLRDPEKNVRAGSLLLATLLKHYEGDVISALIAYNAHPRELGSPVPRNGETLLYVRNVLRYFREYEHQDGNEIATAPTKKKAPQPSILRPSQVLAAP
jgi:soluble lytic murein transglycosylase-like protein